MPIKKIQNKEIFCSVVMPVHDGEEFLAEAIRSVLNQTYTNFEFLIIENCSTDSSLEIVKSYDDTRIRLIIETNCGQVQAYNRGFRESKGEYIFIHDQDDISNIFRFEKQLYLMLNEKIDICGSFYNFIDQNSKIIGKDCPPHEDFNIKERMIYNNDAILNSSICFRSSIIDVNGLFKLQYFPSADYQFYLRLRDKYKFANITEYLYSWRQHSSQISIQNINEIREQSIKISLENLDTIKSELDNGNYLYYKGLILYYNDKLLISLMVLIRAVKNGSRNRMILRYIVNILFGGVIIKILRKYKLTNRPIFVWIKKIVNILFAI